MKVFRVVLVTPVFDVHLTSRDIKIAIYILFHGQFTLVGVNNFSHIEPVVDEHFRFGAYIMTIGSMNGSGLKT
jgi:hypothetical protein